MASPSSSPKSSSSVSIYDPEEPVLPISPCDSPPVSPPNSDTVKQAGDNNNSSKQKSGGRRDNEDEVPSSAVQLKNREKYLEKLNRQERAIEEVKIALKPHYLGRSIDKQQYKDVLRRAVPKVRLCAHMISDIYRF